MKQTKDTHYEGERPLFASHGLYLEEVATHAGESALKECSDVEAVNCRFEGRYLFWHNNGLVVENCLLTERTHVVLWYSRNLKMKDTLVEAPKMFREMDRVELENVQLPNALETLWYCRNVELNNVKMDKGNYFSIHEGDIRIKNFVLNGNYSFQYRKSVEIRHAEIHLKGASWNMESVTVYDSVLDNEYLGWHSKNLRLVNCKILGTQPPCYARDLIMENCTMADDADLAFEHSSVKAMIKDPAHSVKNPRTGNIIVESFGTIVPDKNLKAPGNCELKLWNGLTCSD